jgi:hypothetical protein
MIKILKITIFKLKYKNEAMQRVGHSSLFYEDETAAVRVVGVGRCLCF